MSVSDRSGMFGMELDYWWAIFLLSILSTACGWSQADAIGSSSWSRCNCREQV